MCNYNNSNQLVLEYSKFNKAEPLSDFCCLSNMGCKNTILNMQDVFKHSAYLQSKSTHAFTFSLSLFREYIIEQDEVMDSSL